MAEVKGLGMLDKVGQVLKVCFFKQSHGRQRQQPHHRAHLQAHRRAIRQPQDIVEETVLLIPHFILVFAQPVHRPGNPHRMLEKFADELLVQGIVDRQFDGNPEHLLTEKDHPGGAVRLFQVASGGQGRTAVEHPDIVQPRKPPSKTLLPFLSLRLIHR